MNVNRLLVLCRLGDRQATLGPIIASTGWLFGDRVVRMAVGLVVGAWVARYLGPEQFGLLSYALALTGFFAIFAGLGLDNLVVRDLVRRPERTGELVGTAFILKLAGGAAGLLMALAAARLLRADDRLALLLVAIIGSGMVFQSLDVIDLHFQARVQSRRTVLARGGAFLLASAFKVVLILRRAPLPLFAAAWCLEVILGAAGLVAAFRRGGRRWPPRFRPRAAADLLGQAWPLLLTSLAVTLYLRVDQVMLREMAGPAVLGHYAAAVRISELWYYLPYTLGIAAFPAVVAARAEDRARYYRRLQKLYNIMTWSALAASLPLTFLSGPLVRLVFGPGYAAAAPVLSLHVWTSLFLLHGWVKGRWTVLERLQLFALAGAAAAAALNIGLNLLLIPRHGAVGAALATLLAQGALVMLFPLLHRRDRVSVLFFLRSFWPFGAGGAGGNGPRATINRQ